jgi:hypothetical protein
VNDEANNPATDAVKALHLFLFGPEGEGDLSPEKISKELKRAGVDVAKMAAEIRKQIAQAQNRLRLGEIRAAMQGTAEQLTRPILTAVGDLRAAVQEAIDRISSISPDAAAVFHSKLEKSTDADLVSLLSDLRDLEETIRESDEEER